MTPSRDRSLRLRAIFPPYPPIPFFATTRWQGMSSNMRLAPQADPTALAAPRIADHGGQFTVGTHLTIGNALHTAPHPLLKGRAVGLQGQVELPPLSRQIFTDLAGRAVGQCTAVFRERSAIASRQTVRLPGGLHPQPWPLSERPFVRTGPAAGF